MAEEWTQERIEARVRLEALRQGVDPNLAVAVAKQESNLRADNPGDNGASRGVFHMQRAAAIDAGIDPARRDDPETGIVGGIRYLKQRLNLSKGNVEQALSRYNRGTPDYRGIGDPDYVYHVMRHYPGHPLGKEPTDQAGYAARLNRTFGRGTTDDGGERGTMASQTAEKPWWDKFIPRFGPRSAEAAEGPGASKWDAMLPGTPPSAAATQPPPATAPAPAETPGGSKWDTLLPGAPQETPLAAPTGVPEQAPLPTQPAGQGEAPAPSWRVSFTDPQAPPPTAASTPEQDAAYRASVGQGQAPPPTQNPQTEQLPPSPTPTPSTQEMRGVPPGTVLPTPPADLPLEEQNPAKEWAATGIEVGSGVAGSVAGTAVGGVPGFVAGGIAGQGYGSRLNKRLGLRPQEEPIVEDFFGLSLYPSDVANAGFGLLTGGPAMFKSALSKTTAGKTIVQAEMSAKEAYQAWQTQRKVLQEAQATGQEAKLNTALKDHATAEANYKRLVGERNDTIAANKAEYDQAVTDYQTTANQAYTKDVTAKQQYLDDLAERQRKQYGTVRAETERELLASREAGYTKTLDQIKKEQAKYETDIGARQTALESQAAAIPEARALTEPYKPPESSHVLYKEMRKQHSEGPTILDDGKASVAEWRASQPKTLAGTPEPFPGEIETIAQGLEKATSANVATIHEQLKKLGPLTRNDVDGKIRGPAKKMAGILMDILETNPEAAGAIKAANTAFKREMSLEDINDWLKPRHGVIGYRAGKETINPDALLGKFNKEMADSKLFRDSFTPEEAATLRGNLEAMAAKTQPAPPLRAPVQPTPELLPGSSPPPPATGEALPAAAYPERFTKGLAGAPERTPLPTPPELATPPKEVPPIYPEFPAPGKPGGLTVPLEPPAKIPTEPPSTSMWYPEARNKGDWLRKAPPKEGQWTREQWETYAKAQLGKKPGFSLKGSVQGAIAGAGGMAFGLQRMGLSPFAADLALWASVAGGIGGGIAKKTEWMLSHALLNDRYRPLLQEAMLDNQQLNPYFYNAMLAALTPEDRAEYDRMQRSQKNTKR